jgi:antitoxin ParD1/3/4
MSTMNVSLPDKLKNFVEDQVDRGQYGSSSEYVRDLIRRDQDRTQLANLLLDGARSPVADTADSDYFTELRCRAKPETA